MGGKLHPTAFLQNGLRADMDRNFFELHIGAKQKKKREKRKRKEKEIVSMDRCMNI